MPKGLKGIFVKPSKLAKLPTPRVKAPKKEMVFAKVPKPSIKGVFKKTFNQ